MNVVFFGTPQFAAKVLSYLIDHGIQINAVITKPDRPKGRSGSPLPTPVKEVAQAQNPPIPTFQPAIVSAPEFADIAASFKADLFVVVAYGEIIKQHLLDMPRLGCINLHASLLPKYRGAAPIQRSIIEGETKTGITIMHMVKKMDAGDIIEMKEIPIGPDDTFPEVEEKLCSEGSKLLLKVIRDFEAGIIKRIPQDSSQATYAAKIELEDCEIHWDQPAQKLHNLVRGVTPDPGAWCYLDVKGQRKRLKINRTQTCALTGTPGAILSYGKEGFIIACGEGSLRILDLQLEGKKAMSADEFMRGTPKEALSFE